MIEANGNHWRKILTIMAKLSVTDKNWKFYRDNLLLKQDECISINSNELNPNAGLHIICGQQSAQNLQLSRSQFQPINTSTTLVSKHAEQSIYLCPYLDYRQFPNLQIDLLRAVLYLPSLG
ncbi:hypothetical protein TUM4445_40410 [Shewanella sp. MBTL60-112-B2]|nr:hypothetical protein TUM4444_08580 [Shewanella sp. MBTL60-112-B1]GIU40702.1 hypothetical protein TUM4445_40410 [Shewanella sp. MBTL60-112-B2]